MGQETEPLSQQRDQSLDALTTISPAEQLRESDERFAAVFGAAPFAMALTQPPEYRVVAVNDAFLQLFGFTRDEVIGKSEPELGIVYDEDDRRRIGQLMQTQRAVRDYIYTTRTKRGAIVHLSLTITIVPIAGVPHVLTAIEHVSERVVAQRRLQALAQVTASFAAAQTLADVRRVILEQVTRVLGAGGGALRRVEGDELLLDQYERGDLMREGEPPHFVTLPLQAHHPAAVVARTGEPRFFGSSEALIADYPELAPHVARHGTRANAYLPLKGGAETVGVLSLHFAAPQPWTDDERAFALNLAGRAAAAYERARLYEAEARSKLQAERLQALAARLAIAATPDEIIRAVFAEGFAALGATAGSVVRLDGDELAILASTGYPEDVIRRWQRFPLAASTPLSVAVRTGEGVWIESPAAYQLRFQRLPDSGALARSQAWVALPLRVSSRVLGGIGLSYPQSQPFDAEDRRFTMTLADLCAQALERSWLFAALQASEARFRTIVEATAQIIWTAGPDGTFAGRQESWERFTGQTPAEYADGNGIAAVHPEDREGVLEQWQQVLRTRAPFELAYRLRHHGGGYRYVHARGTPIRAPDGAVVEWVGVAEDRTEQRRRELNTAFLAEISQELAQLDDEGAIMRVAGERIAAQLAVWRCQFTAYDLVEDRATVIYDASESSQIALRGRSYTISAFIGPDGVRQLTEGRQLAIPNTVADPVTLATAEELARLEIGALVITPYHSGGRWAAALTVHERAPRLWHDDELTLLCELAERIWTRIERARAAATLREREAQLSAFMANSPGSLFIKDREGRYSAVNDAFLVATGLTAAELLGMTDHELFPAELAELFVAEDEQVRASGEPRRFEENFTFAGQQFTFLSQKFPLPGGSVGCIGTDITERRRAEEALRDYTQRLQQLNAASLAINAAPTHEAVLQRIVDEGRALLGAQMAVVNFVPRGDWSQAQTVVALAKGYSAWENYSAPATGEGIYRIAYDEQRTLRLSSAELQAHPAWRGFGDEAAAHPPLDGLLVAPLIDGDGKSIGVIQLSAKLEGSFSPADEALLIQLAQLAAIALENQTLYEQEQAARKEAEEANRLKDEFLATVSHELRTPLTALLGYAHLLRTRQRDEQYVARTIPKIERSARAQALIVEDLLDMSRIVSGKLRIELAPVDLVPIVQAALDNVRPTLELKSLQLAVELELEHSTVIGDASRLQQVVWNLLFNAAKFTPEGGSILVRLASRGREAELTVRDTGRGISPAFLPFVFDRFRQADSTSNRVSSGLGLGLAIVQHLVELHGGTVHVASDGEGKGATFTLRLPLAQASDAAVAVGPGSMDAESSEPFPPELQGLRVLVVDDQPAILELLDELLTRSGVVVRLCDNAREALIAFQEWRPDVLLSDLAMPGEDGYWLVGQVRALPPEAGGDTAAIALTAYVRAEERAKVFAAGFQLFVPKPVEPAELRAALAHVARGEAR